MRAGEIYERIICVFSFHTIVCIAIECKKNCDERNQPGKEKIYDKTPKQYDFMRTLNIIILTTFGLQ